MVLPHPNLLFSLLEVGGGEVQSNYSELFFFNQGGILFFNGRLIFHILDMKNESPKTSVPSYVEYYKKDFFSNIPWRKLSKNVNLFHLIMNFFKSQTEKVSRF